MEIEHKQEIYMVYRALLYAEKAVTKKALTAKADKAALIMEAAEYRRLREIIRPHISDLLNRQSNKEGQ